MTGDHRRLRPARLRPAARLLRARNQRAEPVNAPQWQHAMAVQLDQRLRRPGTAAAQPARPPRSAHNEKETRDGNNVPRQEDFPHNQRASRASVPDISTARCTRA